MDAGLVLGQLAEATGVRLADDGACPGGHVGACYVRWPGGRRSVLTSAPAGTAAGVRRVESLLAAARAYRVPAPHYELVAELPTMVAVVQQRLPGVEEIGAAVPGHLAGDDLVHFDFHPENVLADAAGAVTGVVDWDGASRGDGALAPGHCFAEPSRDQAAGQQSGGSLRAGQRFERRVMGLPGITQQGFRAGRPVCQQIEMAEYRAPPGPVASVGGARSQCLGLGYVTAAKQHLDRVENQAAGVGGPRAQRRSLRQPCRCLRHPVPPGNIGFSGARSLFEIRSQIRGECRAAASRGSDPVSKRVIGPGQDCRLLMQQTAPDRPDLVVDHMVRQRVGEQDPAACSGGLLRSQANRDQLT